MVHSICRLKGAAAPWLLRGVHVLATVYVLSVPVLGPRVTKSHTQGWRQQKFILSVLRPRRGQGCAPPGASPSSWDSRFLGL